MISESFFLDQVRLTRIVATLGPASSSATGIEQLIHAGVDVFRINFSHGNQQQHGEIIHQIQAVSERVSKQVAILQDLSGPKLRISELQADHIHLHTGQKIRLEAGIENGDETRLGFLDENWFSEVHSGERIVLGDGLINLHIEQKDRSGFDCKILSGGILRSRAGLSFPDSNLRLGAMRPQDWKDLQFGLEHQVDAVALSFVQSAQDLIEVRGRMKDYAHQPLLIAKIERSEALLHIDAILDQGDGIMVARGDLGISVPLKKLPTIQKMLIRKAREQRKIVITATQMLESMTFSPMPTRAEVTDVANAVFDGTDAVMLSGETAVGIDPPHVVRTMADILVEAEAHAVFPMLPKIDSAIESALSQIIPLLVKEIGARLVLTPLTSGSTAARISRQRIGLPILAGVNTEQDVRRLRFRHAVFPVLVNPGASFLSNLQNLLNQALERKMVQQDDYAVVTGGFPLDHPGVTNFVRVVQVGADL